MKLRIQEFKQAIDILVWLSGFECYGTFKAISTNIHEHLDVTKH